MDQDFAKVNIVSLWPTSILMTEYHENLPDLISEIYRLSNETNNIKKSNYGGWQSNVDLYSNDKFKPLCQYIAKICFEQFGKDSTTIHQMWVGINKKYHHNVIHNHGSQYHVSGVYYVSVPLESGDIVFRDPRPAATSSSARELFDKGECERFRPYSGLILLFPSYLDHFVLPSESAEDRICISFDLTLKD
jgi:uncharacterized protein (TIGR02466 family)